MNVSAIIVIIFFSALILLKYWSVRKSANGPWQTAEKIIQKTKADKTILASFICYYRDNNIGKGCAGLFITDTAIYCENAQKTLFDLPISEIEKVEQARANYHINFVTKRKSYTLAYLHGPEEGKKKMPLIDEYMAYRDDNSVAKLIETLRSLDVKVSFDAKGSHSSSKNLFFALPGAFAGRLLVYLAFLIVMIYLI